ncbi:FMN-binding negative transcriptional regulator [Pseudoalteromonas luteoviolacea]|uniref:FMN-binding negative transcriptional regulator n=1 Tax=Pseudoalteromonas luteoviolacea TaxID=43657 RepID=UPI001B3600F1|nr:FMN-binding negative transcriptional regulator [Pseudoalteromonas luteoviolacea]
MSYPPTDYVESNNVELFEIIERYPLATLFCQAHDMDDVMDDAVDDVIDHAMDHKIDIHSCHMPLSLCRESLTLYGHANPTNPLKKFKGKQIHGVFHGPDTYLSPAQIKGIKLPTWDYATVHIQARLHEIEEFDKQIEVLHHMLTAFETGSQPWQLSAVPEKQLIAMCKSLLFFELKVTHITGQFKLSQNKPAETRSEIANLLSASKSEMSAYYQ